MRAVAYVRRNVVQADDSEACPFTSNRAAALTIPNDSATNQPTSISNAGKNTKFTNHNH